MDDKMPKEFTEEELKELAEISKDAVRWTFSEKDFKYGKDSSEKEIEPQQWRKAVAFFDFKRKMEISPNYVTTSLLK